ncbi:hypothetical protein DFH09DRAFT_1319047 [Mycena vulgaris]|nr:hypothetical protein DFH09DRAFT_1319047 [Mycena vulgaris]
MFSKLLKFGLCALTLTLAAAAPSQQVSISCAISQSGTSLWRVAGEGNYSFVNLEYNLPITYANGTLILAPDASSVTEFALEPAEDKTFNVKVPSEDNVWTLSYPDSTTSTVQLKGANGEEAQRWKFIKVG